MAQPGQNFAFARLGMEERSRRIIAIVLVGFSLTTTLAGLIALVAFDNTPGAPGSPSITWPRFTHLHRKSNRPELLVFAHPYCTCTTATISELATLFASTDSRANPAIKFVVYRPETRAGWSWKSLNDRASVLPKTEFYWDDGGREARRFGATTSGMVLLYDARGALRFAGGITGSRGHEGDNYGLDALRTALAPIAPGTPPHTNTIARSRVFGCAIGSAEPGTGIERLPVAFTDLFTTMRQNLLTILHLNV